MINLNLSLTSLVDVKLVFFLLHLFAEDDIYNILKLVFQLGYNVRSSESIIVLQKAARCYAATLCWLPSAYDT